MILSVISLLLVISGTMPKYPRGVAAIGKFLDRNRKPRGPDEAE